MSLTKVSKTNKSYWDSELVRGTKLLQDNARILGWKGKEEEEKKMVFDLIWMANIYIILLIYWISRNFVKRIPLFFILLLAFWLHPIFSDSLETLLSGGIISGLKSRRRTNWLKGEHQEINYLSNSLGFVISRVEKRPFFNYNKKTTKRNWTEFLLVTFPIVF